MNPTDLDLEAIRARVAKAWEHVDPGQGFGLHARTDIPALLSEVARLQSDLAAERARTDAATGFVFGQYSAGPHLKEWAVWYRPAVRPRISGLTREEAIAHARRLAAGGEESEK